MIPLLLLLSLALALFAPTDYPVKFKGKGLSKNAITFTHDKPSFSEGIILFKRYEKVSVLYCYFNVRDKRYAPDQYPHIWVQNDAQDQEVTRPSHYTYAAGPTVLMRCTIMTSDVLGAQTALTVRVNQTTTFRFEGQILKELKALTTRKLRMRVQ